MQNKKIIMLTILISSLSACKNIKPDTPANKEESIGMDAGESDMNGIFSGKRGAFAFEMDINKKGSFKYLNAEDEKKHEAPEEAEQTKEEITSSDKNAKTESKTTVKEKEEPLKRPTVISLDQEI